MLNDTIFFPSHAEHVMQLSFIQMVVQEAGRLQMHTSLSKWLLDQLICYLLIARLTRDIDKPGLSNCLSKPGCIGCVTQKCVSLTSRKQVNTNTNLYT